MKLTINGNPVEVNAPADTPLLWVLRDELGMSGTKYGCGMGLCGACTVRLDGKPVRSCMTALRTVGGKKVTTIEGLATGETLHPVQQAWCDLDVVQCGYCQSGQIMCAAALLATTPQPTEAQIETAMRGIICRCGTYERIRSGIHRAVELATAAKQGGTP
jgi:isoquinoline 1-oxidoreductase subunit alpha